VIQEGLEHPRFESPPSRGDGHADTQAHPDRGHHHAGLSASTAHAAVSFAPASNNPVGSGPRSVAIGDLNGDGKPDLATANNASTVSVLRNSSASAVTITGGPLTFPAQATGTASTAQTITLTSTGDAALTVSRVQTTGINGDDFLVSQDTCTGAAIPVGASCSIHVRFSPQASGASGAKLVITDDTPGGAHSVVLSGVGGSLPAGPAGTNGTGGTNGTDGPAGPTGPQGSAGSGGTNGTNGAQGAAGPAAKVTCTVKKAKHAKKVKVTCVVTAARATSARLTHRGHTIAERHLKAGRHRVVFHLHASRHGTYRLIPRR
jgi:hypothetical protein